MLSTIQVVTILLVSLGMVPAVAHALELPGKLKLAKEQYLVVQRIYFPGFTLIGGCAEIASVLAALGLVFLVPRATLQFWLTLGAFSALALMHVIFWIFTQPANRFWAREQSLRGVSTAPFGAVAAKIPIDEDTSDWIALRSRWEYSHVARGVLAYVALALLVTSQIWAS